LLTLSRSDSRFQRPGDSKSSAFAGMAAAIIGCSNPGGRQGVGAGFRRAACPLHRRCPSFWSAASSYRTSPWLRRRLSRTGRPCACPRRSARHTGRCWQPCRARVTSARRATCCSLSRRACPVTTATSGRRQGCCTRPSAALRNCASLPATRGFLDPCAVTRCTLLSFFFNKLRMFCTMHGQFVGLFAPHVAVAASWAALCLVGWSSRGPSRVHQQQQERKVFKSLRLS